METNIPILNEFLYYLFCVKNYSTNTIKGYSKDLQRFFRFLIEEKSWNIKINNINVFLLGNVKETDIYKFLIYLNYYKNNGANARKRILSAMKTFFKWLFIKYEHLLSNRKNPTLDIPNIEPIQHLPKYIQLDKAKSLETIFKSTNSKYPIRNNTIIILFLNCGLRISELININIEHIDFKRKELRILGKGDKERIVYLNKTCIESLEKYLNTIDTNKGALFTNLKGKRLCNTSIENICQKAFKLAGLKEYKYTAHTLRHTAATYMYKSTKDILLVKEFLGHSSITSTEIYTHVINENIKDAVNKNPLNNYK